MIQLILSLCVQSRTTRKMVSVAIIWKFQEIKKRNTEWRKLIRHDYFRFITDEYIIIYENNGKLLIITAN